jgi:hypothetical protein
MIGPGSVGWRSTCCGPRCDVPAGGARGRFGAVGVEACMVGWDSVADVHGVGAGRALGGSVLLLRRNQVVYGGVLAPRHRWHRSVRTASRRAPAPPAATVRLMRRRRTGVAARGVGGAVMEDIRRVWGGLPDVPGPDEAARGGVAAGDARSVGVASSVGAWPTKRERGVWSLKVETRPRRARRRARRFGGGPGFGRGGALARTETGASGPRSHRQSGRCTGEQRDATPLGRPNVYYPHRLKVGERRERGGRSDSDRYGEGAGREGRDAGGPDRHCMQLPTRVNIVAAARAPPSEPGRRSRRRRRPRS